MPQISVPVAILLKSITPKIYKEKGTVYGTHWDARINVPVAILLRTITSKIYTKIGAVYGTHWDAPD